VHLNFNGCIVSNHWQCTYSLYAKNTTHILISPTANVSFALTSVYVLMEFERPIRRAQCSNTQFMLTIYITQCCVCVGKSVDPWGYKVAGNHPATISFNLSHFVAFISFSHHGSLLVNYCSRVFHSSRNAVPYVRHPRHVGEGCSCYRC
jgi:hypothetical protein